MERVLLSKLDQNNTHTHTHTHTHTNTTTLQLFLKAVIKSGNLRLINYHDLLNVILLPFIAPFISRNVFDVSILSDGKYYGKLGYTTVSSELPPHPMGSAVNCEQRCPERLGCPENLTLLSGERVDPAGPINKFRVMKLTAMQ